MTGAAPACIRVIAGSGRTTTREAARDDFGGRLSDGARLAAEEARSKLFQPDWNEQILNINSIRNSVASITQERT